MTEKRKLVPPDGGWGWVIMFSYALNNLIIIPVIQCFGLVFKDTFASLGMSATDGSVIINTNAAFGMIMGLINGPLLRRFGYRKVSIASALFTFVGVTLTAFANSFLHFFITYGLITSMGFGLGLSSYSLALNTYFAKNRGRATGYGMTITGIGSVLMPQLLSYLMSEYGVEGAVLIIGGISSHTLFAALLLQPVKWHMKEEELPEGQEDNKKNDESEEALLNKGNDEKPLYKNAAIVDSTHSIDHDMEAHSIYGFEMYGRPRSNSSSSHTAFRKLSTNVQQNGHLKNKWWSEMTINSVGTPSTIPKSNSHKELGALKEEVEVQPPKQLSPLVVYDPNLSVKREKEISTLKRYLTLIINFFDLGLLKDPIYLNIMIGMSLAVFAELNFSLLTPFFMSDFGLTTPQIAMFLSILSGSDIVLRFISPFIGDYLKKPPRVMYLVSLFMLILTRWTILFFDGYGALLGVAVGLGIAKGVRTVYMPLVIPSYVPIERLASAAGLQMVVNGVFIIIGGPALGMIRDVTGSYVNCINVINCVTLTTIVMWSVELIYQNIKKSKLKEVDSIP